MKSSPVIPPNIWATDSKTARKGVRAPTRAIPKDTAGLKRPPETRKNTQTLTPREKPKHNAMYIKLDVLGAALGISPCPSAITPLTEVEARLATLVPPSENRMNRVVPANSPIMATKSIDRHPEPKAKEIVVSAVSCYQSDHRRDRDFVRR